MDVRPAARDDEISKRLLSVLVATGWFTEVNVRVEQGVVFLNGVAESDRLRQWAGELARNTQGVVAVANRMREREPSLWDFTPAWSGVLDIWRGFIRSLPLLAFALVILALAFVAGRITTRGTQRVLYFWLNGREHSWLKVRSSVIRLVKRAFQEHGVSMPDEAREVIFPQGVPVQLQQTAGEPNQVPPEASRSAHAPAEPLDAASTKAEAGLYSEAGVIEEQARQVRPLQVGENLLKGKSAR